ncbi:MAG: DoxX family membrane protein [Myxococcales bacterium]
MMTRATGTAHPRADPFVYPQIGLPRIPWTSDEEDRKPARARGAKRSLADSYRRTEQRIVEWMAASGIVLLRVSLGIVFLWFGALKFVPGMSPAEHLAGDTMARLCFGLIDPKAALIVLAFWETAVGVLLVLGVHLRVALVLLLLQMAGTLTPLALFPSVTFTRFPFEPTMEGQYILKNLVLISAAIVIGGTLRGGSSVAHSRIGCRCHGEYGR